ncbi:hypothetical protein ES707_21038 [subsurface metagenome]
MTAEEVQELIRISQGRDLPCILCDKGTRNRGMFFPPDPVAAGVGEPPPGKVRCIVYPLCSDHIRDEYTLTIIEELIRLGEITQVEKRR